MDRVYKKFGEYYDRIYSPVYDYKKESKELEKLFRRYSSKKVESILDIGCGTGSHAITLSKRGYDVTGIDVSSVMIKEAKRKAKKEGVGCKFHVQDMRKLDLDSEFDCAICMFGSFGYLTTKKDVGRFLKRLRKVLGEDGIFLFEFWNLKAAEPKFRMWNRVEFDDRGNMLIRLMESKLDKRNKISIVNMDFYVFNKKEMAETFSEIHRLRCYDTSEIKKVLAENGFSLVSMLSKDMRKNTFSKVKTDSFNLFAIAD